MHMQQAGVRFLPHLAMAWMLAGALFAAVPRGAQAAEVGQELFYLAEPDAG